MTFQAGKQTRLRAARKAMALLPVAVILIGMFSSGLINSWQNPAAMPSKVNVRHVQMLKEKQTAWLGRHPWLMKVTRIGFGAVPSEVVTSACWHLMKAVSGHRHPQNHVPKQTT